MRTGKTIYRILAPCVICVFMSITVSAQDTLRPPSAITAPPADLPPGVLLHIQTAAVSTFSHDLEAFLQRFAVGGSSGPDKGLVTLPAPGRLRGRVLSRTRDFPKLAMLMSAFLKIPLAKLNYFLMPDRGVRIAILAPEKPDKEIHAAALLPIGHFDELVAAWSANEITRYLVSRSKDGTYAIAYPHYGPFYLKPFKTEGIVIARDPGTMQRLLTLLATWTMPGIFVGPDARIQASIPALADSCANWFIPGGKRGRTGSGFGFAPRYMQALMNLPHALIQPQAFAWNQVELAQVDVYFTPASLYLDSLLKLAKNSPGSEFAASWKSPRPTSPLLPMMPDETVCFFSLPVGRNLLTKIEPALFAAVLDQASGDRKPGPLALRLILQKTSQVADGNVCAAFVRGKLSDLALVMAFHAKSPSAANAYVLALKPHLPQLASAGILGQTVCVTLGLQHRELLAGFLKALKNREVRFGRRMKRLYWLGQMPGAQVMSAGAFPVDLAKALTGEIIALAQIYGMPVGSAGFRRSVFGTVRNSSNPVMFGAAVDTGMLRLGLSLPAGAYRDLATMLQRFIFRFHDQQMKIPDDFLTNYLDAMARKWLREQIRQHPKKYRQLK